MSRLTPWVVSFIILILSAALLPVRWLARTASAQDIPPEARVEGVVGHPQSHRLSCESRSASDWAAYFGVSLSEDQILYALPESDNPEAGFVGNAEGPPGYIPPDSYGVHPPPLAQVLRGFGLNAREQRGMTWDALRLEIAAGRPVIVWIIGQMWPGQPVSYTAQDGQVVTVAYYEHTMIVTGYSDKWVYVVDALNGLDQIYDLNSFFQSWSVLGQLAIVLEGEPPAAPTQVVDSTESYTVQPGETLTGLAERFNLPWRDLASYNQLAYPYLLLAGQTLHLPAGSQANELSPTPTAAPIQEITPQETHQAVPGVYRVVPGDTLIKIAERYQTTWQELVGVNQIHYPYFIYADQDLILPETAGAPTPSPVPATATPQPTSPPEVYVIQAGDTLAKVGKRLGLDWRVLATKNGLGYPYIIHAGQVLILP